MSLSRLLAGLIVIVLSIPAQAQQAKKVYRIGYLSVRSDPRDEAFRQGLRELGYVEGKEITLEYRFAKMGFDELPVLASELVRPPDGMPHGVPGWPKSSCNSSIFKGRSGGMIFHFGVFFSAPLIIADSR